MQSDVILRPQLHNLYTDSLKEPQYMTSKDPVTGWIHLNSKDLPPGVDRTNCQIGDNQMLSSGFNRLRIGGFTVEWFIPNINPRNNKFAFYASTTLSTRYEFTIPERFYNYRVSSDIDELATAIVFAMNSTIGHGLTFSSVRTPGYPNAITINATGGTFYWANDSPAALHPQTYNLDLSPVYSASKQIGPFWLAYTKWVDITSTTLTKWQKIKSVTTGDITPIVIRAWVGGNEWGSQFHIPDGVMFNWNASEPLYTIDIHMYDENGDPLYAPNGGKNLDWQLALVAEL